MSETSRQRIHRVFCEVGREHWAGFSDADAEEIRLAIMGLSRFQARILGALSDAELVAAAVRDIPSEKRV